MTQPKIYDPRAEAERLVTVDGLRVDWRDGDSAMCLFLEVPGLGDITAEDYAGGVRVNLATALTAAFSAGASSRDAEVEALRGADWGDEPLPEDAAISAAHPVRSGRHDEHAEAMRLVGAKRSKGALVGLVTWLLVRNAALRGALAEACDGWAAEYPRTSDELVIARLRAVLGSKP